MKFWKTPTLKQVDRAVALIVHVEQYRYFFDRLENPEWILPLKSKGYFCKPPEPQRNERDHTIGFPPWPESRYLARMASLNPDLVHDIVLKIPETENIRVYEDLVDAVLNMPSALSAHFTEKAKTWMRLPNRSNLPERLSKLVVHLAKDGKVSEALDIARVLLEILPDPKYETSEKEEVYPLSPRPITRFDTWNYGRIFTQNMPELVKATGIQAFTLICDLLEDFIRLSRRHDEDKGPEDYSYIWRPAIEGHDQNFGQDVRAILVEGVRDAGELLGQMNTTDLTELVRHLEQRPWRIFHRIALYLLKQFPDAVSDLIVSCLTNYDLFDNVGIRHEYVLLARECFGRLLPEEQQLIFNWIEAGPNDIEERKKNKKAWDGSEATEADLIRYKKFWQSERLGWIKTALPENWKIRYEALVFEYGEAEHPEFPMYQTTESYGVQSPKSAEELKTLSITELVAFLNSWQPSLDPSKHPFGPSPEGLGKELKALVMETPSHFAHEANQFQNLDPTYVRAVICGLDEACKANKSFEWPPVLQLSLWAVSQDREIQNRRVTHKDADPHWGWIWAAIARLLSSGFNEKTVKIPFELRQEVWIILERLTCDPDPTPEDEAKPNRDYQMIAINTVRGEAMHTVIRYALWVRRHFGQSLDAQIKLDRGFDEMSDVRKILDKHLDISCEPSLAIRTVYGKWFPWLVLLDMDWAKNRALKIFPLDKSQQGFFDAAWDTYIIFCAPYNNMLGVLRDYYASAILRLGEEIEKNRTKLADPNKKLAEHLMVYYWRGELDLNDPHGLLKEFWKRASAEHKRDALQFIGNSLGATDTIPPEILQRLKALWEWRLASAQQSPDSTDYKDEMAAFTWWFISGKFEEEWAISQLIQALKISGKAEMNNLVAKRLAELVRTFPKETVQCIELIIKGDRDRYPWWGVYGSQEHIRVILATAIEGNHSEASTTARSLVHYLGTCGYLEFRDLLLE